VRDVQNLPSKLVITHWSPTATNFGVDDSPQITAEAQLIDECVDHEAPSSLVIT
jgi:hypothetical protein